MGGARSDCCYWSASAMSGCRTSSSPNVVLGIPGNERQVEYKKTDYIIYV